MTAMGDVLSQANPEWKDGKSDPSTVLIDTGKSVSTAADLL
jgi:hypothetical protein